MKNQEYSVLNREQAQRTHCDVQWECLEDRIKLLKFGQAGYNLGKLY